MAKPKIGKIHFHFVNDGVNTVINNNLVEFPDLGFKDVTLFGSSFQGHLPDFVKTKQIPFLDLNQEKNIDEIVKRLHEETAGVQRILGENFALGYQPYTTIALNRFADETAIPIICRHHDILHKRREYEPEFIQAGGNPQDMFSKRATHLALTTFDQQYLQKNLGITAHVIPNAVNISKLIPKVKAETVRKTLHGFLGIPKDAKMLTNIGRLIPRKNIEESIATLAGLKALGEDYILVGTLNSEDGHAQSLRHFSHELGVNAYLGAAGELIDAMKLFSIADLMNASDAVYTTSVQEGFGYAFLEAWVAGTPVIGRDLPEQTQDFTANGVDLSHLHTLNFAHPDYTRPDNVAGRMEILRDPEIQRTLAENVLNQLKMSSNVIEQNAEAVRSQYNTKTIAKQLITFF